MFCAEKGIEPEVCHVDLVGGENRREPFLKLNPAGQLPVLEISPGEIIAETVAICEYLDETAAGPRLIGDDPVQRATVRMWTRRVDLSFNQPVTAAFRYGPGLALFTDRVHCLPQVADEMKVIASEGAAWIENQIAGRDYIAGDQFSLADIFLYCFVDFAIQRASLPIAPEHAKLKSWFERVATRPSAAK